MDAEEQARLMQLLSEMRVQHRDLDDAIDRLADGPYVNQLQVRRLKKRKLKLRDYIVHVESRLIPDIDA